MRCWLAVPALAAALNACGARSELLVLVRPPADDAAVGPSDAPEPPRCPTGRARCGGACVELARDDANCGACDHACPAPLACRDGLCVPTAGCAAGSVMCVDRCVDPRTDPANCGACGHACAGTQRCVDARCQDETFFRVASLGTDCVLSDNHEPTAGDDRGGLAVARGAFFYTGDLLTITGDAATLRRGMGGVPRVEGLAADLGNDRPYGLYDSAGGQPGQARGAGALSVMTQLRELDLTGTPNGISIQLSAPVALLSTNAGVYSGAGMLLLFAGAPGPGDPGVWYHVALPTGVVRSLGVMPGPPDAAACETWAHWGVAETFGGDFHVLYTRAEAPGVASGVYRYTPRTGAVEPVLPLRNRGDVCMLALSPSLARWYFHFEVAPDIVPHPPPGEFVASCSARLAMP